MASEQAPTLSTNSGLDDCKNLPDVMRYWAQKTPDTAAFIFRAPTSDARHVLSYGALHELSGRWAGVLRARGLGRGVMVVNALPNCPERVVAECGVLLAGATSVNGMYQLRDASDLIQTLRQARATAIMLDPDVMGVTWDALSSHFEMDDEMSSSKLKGNPTRLYEENLSNDASDDALFDAFSSSKLVKLVKSDALPHLKLIFLVYRRTPLKTAIIQSALETNDGGSGLLTNKSSTAFPENKTTADNDDDSADRPMAEATIRPVAAATISSSGSKSPSDNDDDCNNGETKSAPAKGDGLQTSKNGDFLVMLQKNQDLEVFHSTEIEENDLCTVFTTSGTTGFSKLVAFSHKTLMDLSRMIRRPPGILYTSSPLGWSGGHAVNSILSGSTRVLCDTRASDCENSETADKAPSDIPAREGPSGRQSRPEELSLAVMAKFIYDCIVEENPAYAAVPFQYFQPLAEHAASVGHKGPVIRIMGLGAQPVTKRIVQEASKIAPMLVVGYASTEAMFIASTILQNPDDYEEYLCGKNFPGAEIKIRDEEGRDAKPSQRGEIMVKSPYLFHSYLNDPESTAKAFTEDGYFRTGDMGWIDEQGRLFVEGRGSDAIMRGSYIFYPGWLETRIRACPGVVDIMVVGVPDPVLTQELCACVVAESPDVSMEDVRQMVEMDIITDENDPKSPRPRYYLAFDSLPCTHTDKINRRDVQRIATERLGIAS